MTRNKIHNITKECQSLESELSKYKLCASLIPEKSFYANLRKVLTKKKWDLIRNFVYERDSYKCSICGRSGVKLEAHENWKYGYINSIQKLHDIKSLCRMCHLNKHLGLASILAREDKLDYTKIVEHWCKTNNEELTKFGDYEEKVYKLWYLRNKFDWKIVDKNNKEIFKDLNYNGLIESIKQIGK